MLVRLFVFFGGLFVLALTAALVGPYFIDWTGYRADFEREASAILGRKVTVHGSATARLLPFPSVTFADVTVGEGKDGQAAMTVETFSMDAELAPFLSGEILIFDMRLVRPKVTIEVAEDGTVDWTIRPSTPVDAERVAIEKLTVTEGQIAVHHAASGRTHLVSEINTEIAARSLAGPWHIDGSARLDGYRTGLAITTGKLDEGGSVRLKIRATPEIVATQIDSEGNIRISNGAPLYAGTFRMTPRAEPAKDKPAQKAAGSGYRISGKFQIDDKRLAVDEFRYEVGPLDDPYSADGKAFVEFIGQPRFSVVADGAQVRFDAAVGGEKPGGLTFPERLAALHETLLDLPRPRIPGTVEIKLPAIVAGDTTVRDVALSAEPAAGGWNIKAFSAALPGRTTLEAKGTLSTADDIGFAGSLLLAVGQPSGFAAWLSKDVDDAIRRLPAAGFHADVDLTERRQTFSNLELQLGDATFRGEAESRQPADARGSATLRLSGGALDLDGLSAFASLFVSDQGTSRLVDRDLDLVLKAGPVSAAGLTAETVDTALRLRGRTLEIDRLSVGGLAGATISATATVRGFPADPSGKLDASILSDDLAPLIEAAQAQFGANPFVAGMASRAAAYRGLFRDARLDLVATASPGSGGKTDFAISGQGNAGGNQFSGSLLGNGALAAPADASVKLSLEARAEDATELLALYGVPVLPLGVTGPGMANVTASGSVAGGLQSTVVLSAGDLLARFEGMLASADDGFAAKGAASLRTADLDPWLMTTGIQAPGLGGGLPLDLKASVDYSKGMLVVADLHGTFEENAIDGDLNAEIRGGKPHLTGQLTLDELDLDRVAVTVLGADALASGGTGWSNAPFVSKPHLSFTIDMGIAAATVSVGPFADAFDAGLRVRLDDGGLRVSDIDATLFGGNVSGVFDVKNNGGDALFSAQLKLAGADLVRTFGDSGLKGTGDVSVAISASGKSIDGLMTSLSGSGTASLTSLTIAGLNPDALKAFIARADAIGRSIDQVRVAEFAPQIAADGLFAAGPTSAALTIAGGVVRTPPVRLENPAATIEADLQADLNTGKVSASGTINYVPGDEALVGSEPALGFSIEGSPGSATRVFDTAPLAQFLTQRALEIEQARVEAMQAQILEKQRLRRETRYYASLQTDVDRKAEELRRLQEEAARADAAIKAEAAAKAADEARRLEAERRKAEEQRLAEEAVPVQRVAPVERVAPPPINTTPPPMQSGNGFNPPSLDGFTRMLEGTQ